MRAAERSSLFRSRPGLVQLRATAGKKVFRCMIDFLVMPHLFKLELPIADECRLALKRLFDLFLNISKHRGRHNQTLLGDKSHVI
jgi:hypothetical protein